MAHSDMSLECNLSTKCSTTLTPGSSYQDTILVMTFFLLQWFDSSSLPQDKHHTETFPSLVPAEFSTLIFCSLILHPVSSQTILNSLSMFIPLKYENTLHSVKLLLSPFCLMHYFILPDPGQMCCNLLGLLCLGKNWSLSLLCSRRSSVALCPNFYFGTMHISYNQLVLPDNQCLSWEQCFTCLCISRI